MNQKTESLKKIDTIRTLLDKMKPEIQKVLPKHLDPARIIRMALTDFQTVKHLNECTPESFLGALMECSQLGLEPGRILGQAYLLPFRNKQGQYICRLIPGYQGLCEIARRSGEIKAIYARAVFERDEFDYSYGLDESLTHKPFMGERGNLVCVYAIARLTSGEIQFDVMGIGEVEKIHARSKAAEDGPWVSDYTEMAKKTVLKRLCKSLPASVELRRSLAMDVHEDEIEKEPVDFSGWQESPTSTTISTGTSKPYTLKTRLATKDEGQLMLDNDLLDARLHFHDVLAGFPAGKRVAAVKEASMVLRDGGHFWLELSDIDNCQGIDWIRQTTERLKGILESGMPLKAAEDV